MTALVFIAKMWAWYACAKLVRPLSHRLGWLAMAVALRNLHAAARLVGKGPSELDAIQAEMLVAEAQGE